MIDSKIKDLGKELVLLSFLEAQRAVIEALLEPLD